MEGKTQDLTFFPEVKMNTNSLLKNTSLSIGGLIYNFDFIHLALVAIAVVIGVLHVIHKFKHYFRLFRTRHLRKIWGIKNGDHVIVICSELDDAEQRQNVEPKEFIYNLKYGDVDAYFEVVITLLRLFPDIKLSILSSGEAENTRIDMARHIILIGGPDYNAITARILEKNITSYNYKKPYVHVESGYNLDEIALHDQIKDKEYYECTDEKDYGYFERIRNPNNPDNKIILIGGCHTIGVTGAIKAFSMFDSEQGEIPDIVLKNAKIVAKKISKQLEFSVLVKVERVGQTVNRPIIDEENITVKN